MRSCPKCDFEEVERLLKQRKTQNEKRIDVVTKVRKSVRDYSGEVQTTVDGIDNVNTLLDSGSNCRMALVGLVKALSREKF